MAKVAYWFLRLMVVAIAFEAAFVSNDHPDHYLMHQVLFMGKQMVCDPSLGTRLPPSSPLHS
jgi:hypothetical protein